MSITIFWLLVAYTAGMITVAFILHYRSLKKKNEKQDLIVTLTAIKDKRKCTPPKESQAKELNIFYPNELEMDQAEEELVKFFKGDVKGVKNSVCRGIAITKHPFKVKVPEGYELPKLNHETGQIEYSDGTVYHGGKGLRKVSS